MEAEKESRSRKVYTGMRQECKGDEGMYRMVNRNKGEQKSHMERILSFKHLFIYLLGQGGPKVSPNIINMPLLLSTC